MLPSESRRPTQADVAREAGVSQSAVSVALGAGGSGTLTEATRRRVLEAAEKLGYRPDPMLARLAHYRRGMRPREVSAALAWVTNFGTQNGWLEWPAFAGYHEGAKARAAELGYRLETFWLRAAGMSVARVRQILGARGIQGVLFAPQPAPDTTINFDLTGLAAVSFGFTLRAPRLHVATYDAFHGLQRLTAELRARGYRRIGLALREVSDARGDFALSGSYLSDQRHLPARERVRPLIRPVLTPGVLRVWLAQEKPDAVVTMGAESLGVLQTLGRRVPEDIGFALLSVKGPDSAISGLYENPRMIGAKAVEFLIAMLQRRETGEPEVLQRLFIEGSWVEGATLRPRTSGRVPG